MAVYKIFPSADATVYSAYPAKNTGRDEVLEVSVKNSQDPLRYPNRDLATSSPYYNYDLAVDDNYSVPTNTPSTPDIRRALLQFSDQDIATVKSLTSQAISGSWKASLRLNLAFAQNLNTTYSLDIFAVSQSWAMGTGKYSALPESRNGVSWDFTGPYSASVSWFQDPLYWNNILLGNWESATWLKWDNVYPTTFGTPPVTFTTTGASWRGDLSGSQYFDYMNNKDVNADITDIVDAWFTTAAPNYGVVIKHPQAVEINSGSFVDLKFFSVDTHTIYPPCIDIKWDDSNYYPVGGSYVLNDQFTITMPNNPGTFKQDSVYKFRTFARDTFPARQFTTSSVYLQSKYLPQETYWALQDLKTNEMIIDFDEQYTKLSADSQSNYFYMYMNGLEPERYYRILIKTKIYSTTFGPLSVYDNEQSIYDALAIYSAEELALLPAEEMIIDNNIVIKVIR